MSPLPLIFPSPPGSELVSGGNIYNRELAAELLHLRPVEVIDADAWERALAADAPGLHLVDTLLMERFLAAALAPRPDRRALLLVHHLPSLEPDIAPDDPGLAVEAAALERFDGFVTTSPYTSAYLRERGVPAAAIVTVPPGLPDIPRPALSCPARVRMLMAGNLIARKAVLPLLQALAAALTPRDDLRLDIVGRADLDPAYAHACERLIASEPALQRTARVHGPVTYQEMDAHYQSTTAFVSASRMETYGMALAEARAYGVPILACDGGNSRNHFTDGVDGHLYRDPQALAAGVLALARAPDDAAALFARAQATRPAITYTWSEAARTLDRGLAELVWAASAGE
ncbi:MAG: glycosyltransferase family 4 protein [Haliangiales bacterium]